MWRSIKDSCSPGGMLAPYFWQSQQWVCPKPGVYMGRNKWRPWPPPSKRYLETPSWNMTFPVPAYLINFDICLNCSGFSKRCQSGKLYNMSFPPSAPLVPHVSWRDTAQLMVIKVACGTEMFKWKFSPSCGPKQKTNRKIDPNGEGRGPLNDVWNHRLGWDGMGWDGVVGRDK